MIAHTYITENRKRKKIEMELDEIGVIITGMAKNYLKYLPEQKGLSIVQNKLIRACTEKEIPVIVIQNEIYGNMPYNLNKTLENHHLLEKIDDYRGDLYGKVSCSNLQVRDALERWQVKNVIITGTDLFGIENLVQSGLRDVNDIITSRKLIASKNNAENQAAWFMNNGSYFNNHQKLIDFIYLK